MRKRVFAFLTLPLLLWQTAVYAAGFNCALATLNETERAICTTPYLSGLDSVTNKLFKSALSDSLSIGTLTTEQNAWLGERNRCRADVDCIREIYLQRNAALSGAEKFQPVQEVFIGYVDPPLAQNWINEHGFVIQDRPWRIRKLFNVQEIIHSLGLTRGNWEPLHHLVVDNDLILFFSVTGYRRLSWIVALSEHTGYPRIVARYDSDAREAPEITLMDKSSSGFTYHVYAKRGEDSPLSLYQRIDSENGAVSEPQASPPVAEKKPEVWTSYCADAVCKSILTSPDGEWHLATGSRHNRQNNSGIFLFSKDAPQKAVDVFLPDAERKSEDWSYMRNFAWGNKESFFFDNEGGLACIWKTDLSQKTTQRILPVEGLKEPYYIRYNDEDYILSFYYPDGDDDSNLAGFYIAKSGDPS